MTNNSSTGGQKDKTICINLAFSGGGECLLHDKCICKANEKWINQPEDEEADYPHSEEVNDLKNIIHSLEKKLSEKRGGPVWVNVSDRLPKKRTNCFVFCHTDLHGGYDYKATRLWTGEKWVDELNARTEPVVRWLDEAPPTPSLKKDEEQ